ncbi:unnamed protein product [Dovyalis caffra]|uniref:Uncharacterized protein n=1 Tax=Dovyalis caffra TaxID=77055 RepID=A0AAV1SRG0_9ROSI|nr:unnamed protein product [Dovyalis caffra]
MAVEQTDSTLPESPPQSHTKAGSPAVNSTATNTKAQGTIVPSNGNLISLNASSQIPLKLSKGVGN